MAEEAHVHPLDERPDVEVEVDGVWYPGELRGWWDRGGVRLMDAQWRARPTETRIDTFPVSRVREV
jgi:hypothetical protein